MATKTVLVTGANRGIGLKFVEVYGTLGWNVIATTRDPTKAEKLQTLKPYKIVVLDSTDEDSVLRVAKDLEGEAIDLLINNAGIFEGGNLAATTKEDMFKQFGVNCVGTFLVTRAFLPHLKRAVAKSGSANIAQLSSLLGSIQLNDGAFPAMYGYSASKAAQNMVNVTLAHELKSDNIAVFSLHPGLVITEVNPHGQTSTGTSVNGLIGVIDKLTIADTGKFFDYTGASLPW